MQGGPFGALVWVAVIVVVAILFARTRRRRGGRRSGGSHVGPAAAGTIYDWLNEEKRNAVEIIIENRAGARDAEYPDGNLPDLENPKHGPARKRRLPKRGA